ncbi:MAG: GDSL-type esterase/lipase family protein [Actinomycetota bacterium]
MEKKSKFKKFIKTKTFIAIASVIVLLAIALPLAYMYYNQYLDIPNFASEDSNYMSASNNEAKPGDTLSYEITIKNEGRVPVSTILIETEIPQHTILVEKDYSYLKYTGEGIINFVIDSLEAGQKETVSYEVIIDSPLDSGTIISTEGFRIDYFRERFEEQETKYFTANLQTEVISQVNLSSSYYQIKDPGTEYLRMGDSLDISFFIENSGDMTARNLKVEGLLPQHTEYVNNSFTSNGDAYIENATDNPIVHIDKLQSNHSLSFKYTLEVKQDLEDNTKILFEPVMGASQTQKEFEIIELLVRAFPELVDFSFSAADENGGDLLANDTIRYTVSFKNAGDGKATNILLKNIIPANTTYLDGNFGQASLEQSGSSLDATIPELKPGQQYSCSYRIKVSPGITHGTNLTATGTLIYDGKEIDSGSATFMAVANYSYNVAVMGDSQVSRTGWTSILNSMFEQRYPYGDFNFIKSGKGGETVVMGYNRMLSSGILGQNPYIFIINYGTNDADISSGTYRTSPEAFRHYLGTMISTIKSNTNAMVVVMSTGPKNESKTQEGANEALRTMNSITSQVCAQQGAVFVDLYNPIVQTGNPNQFLSDGLHYNSNGDKFVAGIAFNAISSRLNKYGTR